MNVRANLIKDFLDAKETIYFNYLNICKVNMVVYGIDVYFGKANLVEQLE